MTLRGSAHAERRQPWQEDAAGEEKINILHKQIDILHEQIAELRTQVVRTADDLGKEIREAERRVGSQLRELASEMHGERSQASRVDARGFGPVASGTYLTGLSDELASIAVLGWFAVVAAVVWTACVFPSWLRDYRGGTEVWRRTWCAFDENKDIRLTVTCRHRYQRVALTTSGPSTRGQLRRTHMKRLVKSLQKGDRFLWVLGFMRGFCVAFLACLSGPMLLMAAAVVRAEAWVKGRGALAGGALEAGLREPMMGGWEGMCSSAPGPAWR